MVPRKHAALQRSKHTLGSKKAAMAKMRAAKLAKKTLTKDISTPQQAGFSGSADKIIPNMSLKIYFAGSMRGGRNDIDIYYKIIETLRQYGRVLTEFVGDKTIDWEIEPKLDDKAIHDTDVAMLEECSCIVAEVTQPSLGVGYEIGRAVAMNKPVLCLYRPQEGKLLSGMIRGAHNGSSFRVTDYKDVADVPKLLKDYFKSIGFSC